MPQTHPQVSQLLLDAGFRHGFYGRVGGQSRGTFASLNCSYSVGDDPTDVAQNLATIAKNLGIPSTCLISVRQVHGDDVFDADNIGDRSNVDAADADAIVGSRRNYALSVRTADCVPILVGCRTTGLAAAIHAGWRGLVAGVVPRTLANLAKKGANRGELVAAVGPHIGTDAFEVSPETARELEAASPAAGAVHWPSDKRPHVRLGRIVSSQLQLAGLNREQIDDLGICTWSNAKQFFSFRRDGARSGRQLSAIVPRGGRG